MFMNQAMNQEHQTNLQFPNLKTEIKRFTEKSGRKSIDRGTNSETGKNED